MQLYVCYGTWTSGGHACGRAHKALTEAGHSPKVTRSFGSTMLPDFPFNMTPGRRAAKRLTGKSTVPVLVLDDGTPIAGSQEIADWARANPA